MSASPETVVPPIRRGPPGGCGRRRRSIRDPEGVAHRSARIRCDIGVFLEVGPPRRVVFTWGRENDQYAMPPRSTEVEVSLIRSCVKRVAEA